MASMPPPAFVPFALEEWQSRHERSVEHQLDDSGVQPLTLRELVDRGADLDGLLDLELHYPEVNGTLRLRRRIADLHPGREPEGVLVTVGAAEANAIAVETLTGPGDEVVAMTPSYPQVEGLARNRGCLVRTFPLDPERGWRPDLDWLAAAVTPATRLVAVCNPNNPTGAVLTEDEMAAIVEIVERAGAWLLADEVYVGMELAGGAETRSFVGRSERVVGVGSTSKAYFFRTDGTAGEFGGVSVRDGRVAGSGKSAGGRLLQRLGDNLLERHGLAFSPSGGEFGFLQLGAHG